MTKLKQFDNLTLIGSCDWISDCGCCGKNNLKKTFVFRDEDSNFFYFGSECATKAVQSFKVPSSKNKNTPSVPKIDKITEIEINGYKYRLVFMSHIIQYVELWNPSKRQYQPGLCRQLRLEINESKQHQDLLQYL